MTDSTIPLKRCTNCQLEYPATADYFYPDKGKKAGLRPDCKSCKRKQTRIYHQSNPEKVRTSRKANLAKDRERKRRDYRNNPQKYRTKNKKWEAINKDKMNASSKAWRKTHPEKLREYARLRRMSHPEEGKIYFHRRRAKAASLASSFTPSDWDRCLRYWEDRCAVCGRPAGLWHTLAMDHWVPVSDPSCPGTVPTNIVPLCHGIGGCNNAKSNKSPEAWLKEKLSANQAQQKSKEIQEYFDTLR